VFVRLVSNSVIPAGQYSLFAPDFGRQPGQDRLGSLAKDSKRVTQSGASHTMYSVVTQFGQAWQPSWAPSTEWKQVTSELARTSVTTTCCTRCSLCFCGSQPSCASTYMKRTSRVVSTSIQCPPIGPGCSLNLKYGTLWKHRHWHTASAVAAVSQDNPAGAQLRSGQATTEQSAGVGEQIKWW
jgi:hypothetical protein